ncbi:MAG: hypothetical protein WAT74_01270 [Flavobacteriales bacterium]
MRNTLFTAMLVWMLPIGTNAQTSVTPDIALGGAIEVKDVQMLLDAIKNGADLNRKFPLLRAIPGYGMWNLEKATPLHYAIMNDWYDGALELLRAGAKPNVDSEATISGYNWKSGCTAKSMDAVSPILLASLYNNIDIAKVLVIAGSDTKGLTNLNFVRKCNVNGVEVKLVMWHLRQNCSEAFKEVLKDGKKSAWAANGLPAPGAKP